MDTPRLNTIKFNSRCLQKIQPYLQHIPRSFVLDLSSPCNSQIQFLSNANCKSDFLSLNRNPQLEFNDLPQDQKYNVVFCWDILNFFTTDDISEFLNYLNAYTSKDALFYFFMRDKSQMPATPCGFRIVSSRELEVWDTSYETTSCPRHPLRSIKKAMPEFASQNGSLLRNGLQEHMWIKNPSKGSKLDLLIG